jgi:putative transposase
MHFTPGDVYHLYNRGNNKQLIFFSERNYDFFLQKIKNQISPCCEVLCWCLMPNHFHLMIYATQKSCAERNSFGGKPMQELPYQIGVLLSSYSQAINKQNGTTGSLFQQKTKAKCIDCRDSDNYPAADYLITCMHYIHQNPWKANMVDRLEDWKYSSFREYTGGEELLICNRNLLLILTGYDESLFYQDSYGVLDLNKVESIW